VDSQHGNAERVGDVRVYFDVIFPARQAFSEAADAEAADRLAERFLERFAESGGVPVELG